MKRGGEIFLQYDFKAEQTQLINEIKKEEIIVKQVQNEIQNWKIQLQKSFKKDLDYSTKLIMPRTFLKEKWKNKLKLEKEIKDIDLFELLFLEISSKQEKKTDGELILFNLFKLLNLNYNFFYSILEDTFKYFFIKTNHEEERIDFFSRKNLEINFTSMATILGNNILQSLKIFTCFLNPFFNAKKTLEKNDKKKKSFIKEKNEIKSITEHNTRKIVILF
jgi:hypothetical protein